MSRIAVIGAGALGSRHLQALALIQEPVTIDVVDPDQKSLDVAQTRFKEVDDLFNKRLNYLEQLPAGAEYELVIVATNSMVRLQVLQTLLSSCSVQYLVLEKFLFPDLQSYGQAQDLIQQHTHGCWVNCPRRMFPIYQHIKQQLAGDHPTEVHVAAGDIGLGSNAIHFLDLFAYLTDSADMEIVLNLQPQVIASKRAGYLEFNGRIDAHHNSSVFSIQTTADISRPTLLTIHDPGAHYIVQEQATMQLISMQAQKQWEAHTQSFNMPFQSSLSQQLWYQLQKDGTCDLPDYQHSAALHLNFLKALTQRYQGTQGITASYCPIT